MEYRNFSAAGAQVNQTETPPAHVMEDVSRQLGTLAEMVHSNADRTQQVIDRAFGAKPQAEIKGNPKEVRSGTTGAILDIIDSLRHSVQWQTKTIDELNRLT